MKANLPRSICHGCNLIIDQGRVVSLGQGMWHLQCFLCVRCRNVIEPDSNLLLLSDGNLLCQNCSQVCSICNLPITDEAVMIGDQSYHSSCFKCTNCKNKIDGTLLARTSDGIYCMNCYAERKEAQKRLQNALPPHHDNQFQEKSLPSLPIEALLEKPDSPKDTITSNGVGSLHGSNRAPSRKQSIDSQNTSLTKGNDLPLEPGKAAPIVEEQYTQEYVQLLCADIKSLQKQLVESEFNCTRLKLQNDQTTERIKIIQEEFTKEISRRKAAEATLAQLQNDNRTTEIATLNASSKTAQLENTIENLRSEISELNIQKLNLQKEVGELSTVKRSFSGSPLRSNSSNSNHVAYREEAINIPRPHSTPKIIDTSYISEAEKISYSNSDQLSISDGKTVVSKSLEKSDSLDVGSHMSPGIDPNIRGRITNIRRSLDARAKDLMKSDIFQTIRALDDITIRDTNPPSPKLNEINNKDISSTPESKNAKQKFNWKKAFKIPSNEDTNGKNPYSGAFHSESTPALSSETSDKTSTPHALMPHAYIRPIRCDFCGEKMWSIQNKELRCHACGYHCHNKCAGGIPHDCPGPGVDYHATGESTTTVSKSEETVTIKPMNNQVTGPCFGTELVKQIEIDGTTTIPLLVQLSVKAVESRALTLEGIYRKSGPSSQMRQIHHDLAAGQQPDLSDPDKYPDITAVTSVLKQYFRDLPIPLFTFELYDDWMQAIEIRDEHDRNQKFLDTISKLPTGYLETLVYIMDHLKKVKDNSQSNLMNPKNIGVVFGPTLIKCQSDEQDFNDMARKNATIELLVLSWPAIRASIQVSEFDEELENGS